VAIGTAMVGVPTALHRSLAALHRTKKGVDENTPESPTLAGGGSRPGGGTDLRVAANSGARCGVHAADRFAVRSRRPNADISVAARAGADDQARAEAGADIRCQVVGTGAVEVAGGRGAATMPPLSGGRRPEIPGPVRAMLVIATRGRAW
jgi:hypothetical protein